MWQEEWFMDSSMYFSFYIIPGFGAFLFYCPPSIIQPISNSKFGQEGRWEQYPDLETPAWEEEWSATAMWLDLPEIQTDGCSSQMEKRREKMLHGKEGGERKKTNLLPSPSGKSIKKKKCAISKPFIGQ